MTTPSTPQRADWRRNRERLLSAAADVVARDGAGASLEEIARRAGVGSATLHRHFRTREALLGEVFRGGVEHLAESGSELTTLPDGEGLATWLDELVRYTAVTRGLAISLRVGSADNGCHGVLAEVATELVAVSTRAGRLRAGVTVEELMALTNGIAIQAEGDPDLAGRLLDLAMVGALRTA